ncbi:MAG: MIP/aquaporin family protein [Pseudomonadota bacterium]
MPAFPQKLAAEALGTAFLLTTVIGSGIMGETLAGGNVALALLGNTLATGAILVVLILIFGPVSGAHFNPAVTFGFLLRREITTADAVAYTAAQIIGGIIGVIVAHIMFDAPLIAFSETERAGLGQLTGEAVATLGLLLTIFGCVRFRPDAVAFAVGLFITAGYWFTSSTSFANPAVTLARTLSDTFAGIRPVDAPAFILVQLAAAALAVIAARALFDEKNKDVAEGGRGNRP